MRKQLFFAGAVFSGCVGFAAELSPETWTEKMTDEWNRIEIKIKSSADGTDQPAYFYLPPKARKNGGKAPMLVMLHTWSYGYKAKNPAAWAITECCRRGWAFLYPHFRGPNKTPQGCGSDLAVQDIADGVKWALANHPIDPNRVYIMGGSGGGHMSLLMAGRHPELFAASYAACPITDIARWYAESSDSARNLYPSYAKMIQSACGGKPEEKPEEYVRRSPLTWIGAAKKAGVAVSITTGIHDGHKKKGGGSVPIGHSVRAYNALALEKDRITDAQMESMERTEQVPPELAFEGTDPYFKKGQEVLLRRTSGNVRLTVFNAGHAGNFVEGAAWLALQKRGEPADWNVPPPGSAVQSAAEVTK